MNKQRILLVALILVVTLAFAATVTQAQDVPAPTITLLNPPAGGVLELAVGEAYSFQVQVTSDVPFTNVLAAPDPYYPGRGFLIRGNDSAHHATTALLEVTIVGKNSTASLPGGFAPLSVVVGVRYQGGIVIPAFFDFQVIVP